MRIILFILIICSFTMPGWATVVAFEIEGYIDTINSNENNAIPDLTLNQPFNGWLSYSSVPDQNPIADYGIYHQNASIVVNMSSQTLSYIDDYVYIRVTNEYYSDEDVFSFLVDASSGDFNFTKFGVELSDSTGTVYDNDVLPLSFNLEDFDFPRLLIIGDKNGNWLDIEGEITHFQYIPEPSMFLLLAFGGLFLRQKRRYKSLSLN